MNHPSYIVLRETEFLPACHRHYSLMSLSASDINKAELLFDVWCVYLYAVFSHLCPLTETKEN